MPEAYWLKDNTGKLIFGAVLFEEDYHGSPLHCVQFCDGQCGGGDFLDEACLEIHDGSTGLCMSWKFPQQDEATALFEILKTVRGRASVETYREHYRGWPYDEIHEHLKQKTGTA